MRSQGSLEIELVVSRPGRFSSQLQFCIDSAFRGTSCYKHQLFVSGTMTTTECITVRRVSRRQRSADAFSQATSESQPFIFGTRPAVLPKLHVRVSLKGLPSSKGSLIADAYCPRIRRSPVYRQSPAQHLDVVSTWKGLTLLQAAELLFWEKTFADSLARLVREMLVDAFEEELGQRSGRQAALDALASRLTLHSAAPASSRIQDGAHSFRRARKSLQPARRFVPAHPLHGRKVL